MLLLRALCLALLLTPISLTALTLLPFSMAAWADDDDGDSDSDSDGDSDGDDDDDGDSDRGGRDRDDDDDDDRDDDDDDDDGDHDDHDDDDDDDDDRDSRMPSNLSRQSSGSDGQSRVRRSEISAARLSAADLRRLEQSGYRVIRRRNSSSGILVRLSPPRGVADRAALDAAIAAFPNAIFDLSHVYSPSSTTYGRAAIGMPVTGSCLANTRIGIIDTAIANHASLRGTKIRREAFSNPARPGAHGTAVASIIAGFNPAGGRLVSGAEIYSAAVFNGSGKTLTADAIDLVAALDWMADNRVRVVNLSIAGPPNALLEDAVARSAQSGVLLVAAAGNSGARGAPRYPAAYPSVVAVTAVDRRGRVYNRATRGNYIDIAAPGVDVWGADLSASAGAAWSGTSFAAPFVTVELAAAVKRGQVRDHASALAWLSRTATDLGPRGKDRTFGLGLMQAQACR